jgi:cysteine desulfurase / selenocysteine lyase
VTLDIDLLRKSTPGCKNVLHFNNAGAALMPSCVLQNVKRYLDLESEIGSYEAAEKEKKALEKVYSSAAGLLSCQGEEIAVLENASRAWSLAFSSIPFQAGDKILTSLSEYSSNYLVMLHISKKTGAQIEIIPDDSQGQVCLKSLVEALDSKVRVIAITHLPANNGLVNPAEAIGKMARERGILFFLDATQSIGQIPLDVNTLSCDVLCGTGRKYLRGPRGTALLYVRKEIISKLEPPFPDLHSVIWEDQENFSFRSDARCFESWESSHANKIGLDKAINYALDLGLEKIETRILDLSCKLRSQLKSMKGVSLLDYGERKSGIVTFFVQNKDSEEVKKYLQKKKINLSTYSKDFARLNMKNSKMNKILRASLHYYNTEEEIEKLCSTLFDILITIQKSVL